jgi:tetratricopeptide (TPR) repeat protein
MLAAACLPTGRSGDKVDPPSRRSYAMKRTQRNLLIILSTTAVVWILLQQLPLMLALPVVGAMLLMAIGMMLWGRDFVAGRYRSNRRNWRGAIESYQRFEKKLLGSRWSGLVAPLYLGIYTFDVVALVRNNIGEAFMNLRELDAAGGWLRAALQRDPLYATPYVNLGVIAAMRKDGARAQREFQRAVDLGYSPTGVQQLLRKVLATASEEGRR